MGFVTFNDIRAAPLMTYNLPTLINKSSFRANIMSVGISLIVVKL